MDKNSITLMEKSKRLQLSFWQGVDHYFPVFFVLLVPLFTTYSLIQHYFLGTYEGVRSPEELARTGYTWVLPAIVLAHIQWKRLDFKAYNIKATIGQLESALKKTAEDLNWAVEKQSPNFIRAFRDWDLTASWGEMITIIRTPNQILINSICDPNKRSSVASFGMNKTNIRTFLINLYNTVHETTISKPEENYNHWSQGNNLFRLIAYPFCLGLIVLSIFGLIPNQEYALAIMIILIVGYYFYTDLYREIPASNKS